MMYTTSSGKSITFTCENAMWNKDLLYPLAYGQKAEICKYYLSHPYGIIMLSEFSESELLFMMPNNVKRRLGLPMTRLAKRGRNKVRFIKQQKYEIYKRHSHSIFGTAIAITEGLV